jgi:hypothetical protein
MMATQPYSVTYNGPATGGPNDGEVLGCEGTAIRVARYPDRLTDRPRDVRFGMYDWDDIRRAWTWCGWDDGRP